MKYKAGFNVPRFIPRGVKKYFEQVGLEYRLFLQNLNIKRELVVAVEMSSKEKFNKLN